jgi:DNA invertase Pin-like site-specific DNA recombinase
MKNDFGYPQTGDRCAYYGRVSTPRQKLEHQREHVLRWCESHSIHIPEDLRYEDKEKRHKSAKREEFQRLLQLCRSGKIDWIIICSFDRWGVADPDEFSDFRRQLRQCDVQLFSVVDNLNLTSLNEGDYFRIVALAVGSTRYVEQMAEKNILKMVEMARQGWSGTGNAPFGTDLVCYPLHDLSHPQFRVVRLRYKSPHLYRVIYSDGRIEESQRMPARDKKGTGYRLQPSIESERLEAVRLIYELYDSGFGFSDISERLWSQGYKHYDKPFGYHGVEIILSNPAYIGQPAWGKIGVGAYYILHGGAPMKVRRRASETHAIKKSESQYVFPLNPVFPPIVPVELWKRVHERLANRVHVNNTFGKRRTKNRAKHVLNGKIFCPDCDQPMVFGSTMTHGRSKRYYICGTYRKTQRKKCRANSIPWFKIDAATDELLRRVEDRVKGLIAQPALAKTVLAERWAKETRFGKVLCRIVNNFMFGEDSEAFDEEHDEAVVDWVKSCLDKGLDATEGGNDSERFDPRQHKFDMATCMRWAIEFYNKNFEQQRTRLQPELAKIDAELARIADAIAQGIPSQSVRQRLNDKMAELERRKQTISAELVPCTAVADQLMGQLREIRKTIETSDVTAKAKLLDTFIEKVVPRFEGNADPGKERPVAFEFIPKSLGQNVMQQPMKIGTDRTDRDSSPRPA